MILSVVTKIQYFSIEGDNPQKTATTATIFQIKETEHLVWFR